MTIIDAAALLGRVVVGTVLIVAGVLKLRLGRQNFLAEIIGYGLLPPFAARAVGQGLPILEVGLGACLIAGIAPTLSAVAAAALLTVFTAVIVLGLKSGRLHTCGCFGRTRELRWQLVWRNTSLAALLLPQILDTSAPFEIADAYELVLVLAVLAILALGFTIVRPMQRLRVSLRMAHQRNRGEDPA